MVILVIGLIIAVIILGINNSEYRTANKELRQALKKYQQANDNATNIPDAKAPSPSTNIPTKVTVTPLDKANQVIASESSTKVSRENKVEKQPIRKSAIKPSAIKNTEGIKNTFILMTGAILIVLAAVVFLTSTWHTVPNTLKTAVILLLSLVFVGASQIAQKVFKLKETANTFLYIALAYFPIALFSISMFGLLGDYFSLTGSGRNLYFAVATILMAILYLWIFSKKNKKLLFHASMLMQFLAVIFVANCIEKYSGIILFCFAVYHFILSIYYKTNVKKHSILNIYILFYLFATLFFEFIFICINSSLWNVFTFALITINCYILHKTEIMKEIGLNYYFHTIAILISFVLCIVSILKLDFLLIPVAFQEFLLCLVLIMMYLVGCTTSNIKWKNTSILVATIGIAILYLSTFIIDDNLILKGYFFLWILAILNLVNFYSFVSKNTLFFVHASLICTFLAGISTIKEFSLNYSIGILIFSGILLFVLLQKIKNKELCNIFHLYSNVMIIIYAIIGYLENSIQLTHSTYIFVILFLLYGYGYLSNRKNTWYKVLCYLVSNIVLYSVLQVFKLEQYCKYVICTTTIFITLLEIYNKNLKDNYSILYITISHIISYLIMNAAIKSDKLEILSFIFLIANVITFLVYIENNKFEKKMLYIPFGALIPSVYITKWATFNGFNWMSIASLILIIITSHLSLREEKRNIYTIISAVYLLTHILFLKLNIYLNIFTAFLWTLAHYTCKTEDKTIYELISYILCLALYNTLICDLSKISTLIQDSTIIHLLGYILFSMVLSRRIIKKHFPDFYKILEYIIFSLIYLYAIEQYTNQIDGMIFVFAIALITFFSYLKKMGPIFFTSTIAILLNSFLLTKDFWFSIPWWVYLLVVGSCFITFAVRNEITENKQNEFLKGTLKNIKDNLDL